MQNTKNGECGKLCISKLKRVSKGVSITFLAAVYLTTVYHVLRNQTNLYVAVSVVAFAIISITATYAYRALCPYTGLRVAIIVPTFTLALRKMTEVSNHRLITFALFFFVLIMIRGAEESYD